MPSQSKGESQSTLHETYPYQEEVLHILAKLRAFIKLCRMIRRTKKCKANIFFDNLIEAENDVNLSPGNSRDSLNNIVFLKLAKYTGITGIYETLVNKYEDLKNHIIPVNSQIFTKEHKIHLIQDFR